MNQFPDRRRLRYAVREQLCRTAHLLGNLMAADHNHDEPGGTQIYKVQWWTT
jgi:hypothetical protein